MAISYCGSSGAVAVDNLLGGAINTITVSNIGIYLMLLSLLVSSIHQVK